MSELVDCFARLCRDQPSRPLVHLPGQGRTWTAADLWARADDVRRVLAAAGVAAGDLVFARAADAPTSLALLAATLARGATFAPCDRTMPLSELADLTRRFGGRATVVDDDAGGEGDAEGDGGGSGSGRIALPGRHHLRLHEPHPDAPPRDADIVALKLTSGSTGAPRAVAVTEAQLIADSRRIAATVGMTPDTVQVAATPLSHAYGQGNLVVPLLLQGTAMIRRESFVPHRFVEDALAYGATMFPGVPFMFDHLAAHLPDGAWPPRLDRLMSAGAPLALDTVRTFHARFGVKIRSFYGTSESGVISYDGTDELGDRVTQGPPMPGVTVTIGDTAGTADGAGRLHVASDAVGRGYLGEPTPDFGEGGFLTGDVGRFDAAGHLVLLGRVSSFVNVAGRKVQPDEVERALRDLPGIADVRVMGAADPRRGEQLVACVVLSGPDVRAIDLRRRAAARLAPHKIPHTWVVVDAIPLTERGKTDRGRLNAVVRAHLARCTLEG